MDSYSVIIITDNTTPAMLQVPRYDSSALVQFIDSMMADSVPMNTAIPERPPRSVAKSYK